MITIIKNNHLYRHFIYLPKTVIILSFTSLILAFITSFVTLFVAYFLQGFIVLIGFAEISSINEFLIPILKNELFFLLLFATSVFSQGLIIFLQTYLNFLFVETYNFEMKKNIFKNIFIQDAMWQYNLGNINNLLLEIIPKSSVCITGYIKFFTVFLESIILGIVCLYILPQEFLISIFTLSFIISISLITNKISKKNGKKLIKYSEELNIQLMNSIKNLVFINILGLIDIEKNKTVSKAKNYLEQFKRTNFPYSIGIAFPTPIALAVILILFYTFVKLGTEGSTLVSFFYLLYKFSNSMSIAMSSINGLSLYSPSLKKLNEELEKLGKTKNQEKNDNLTEKKLPKSFSLQAKNITLKFENSEDKKILNNINFDLKENKTLLIKGDSGSGKSTLLMTLIGIQKITEGLISWDGLKFDEIHKNKFRMNIGYLGPEPFLISGSIKENILYGADVEDEKEIWEVLKLSQADIFIKDRKLGINSELNDFGEGLSMGQKQRIGLARALLRKPKILVLDEITANLDKSTELDIVNNLKTIKNKFTILIASHSDAFEEISDKIINLSN